jgi:CBS-domain-containing membrane protein
MKNRMVADVMTTNVITVGELMATHVVTVRPEDTAADAARLMDKHHAGCLPVVDDAGKLRGIISPGPDQGLPPSRHRDPRRRHPEGVPRDQTNPVLVSVDVRHGVVTLTGEAECNSIPLVLPLTRAVEGVVDAEADLSYAIDDPHLPTVSQPGD